MPVFISVHASKHLNAAYVGRLIAFILIVSSSTTLILGIFPLININKLLIKWPPAIFYYITHQAQENRFP